MGQNAEISDSEYKILFAATYTRLPDNLGSVRGEAARESQLSPPDLQ